MSSENSWRKKREIQFDAHNRKAGAAAVKKQRRNRGQRRRNNRIAIERADSFNRQEPRSAQTKTKAKPEHKPLEQKTISRFADYLSEKDLDKLKKIS